MQPSSLPFRIERWNLQSPRKVSRMLRRLTAVSTTCVERVEQCGTKSRTLSEPYIFPRYFSLSGVDILRKRRRLIKKNGGEWLENISALQVSFGQAIIRNRLRMILSFCGIIVFFNLFFIFSGGAELLFNKVKEHEVVLPNNANPCEWNRSFEIRSLCVFDNDKSTFNFVQNVTCSVLSILSI